MTTEFLGNKDNIKEVIEFLNQGLSNGEKVADLRNKLNIGEKKLQKKIKENNYKFDVKKRQYVVTATFKDTDIEYNTEKLQKNYNSTTNSKEKNYNSTTNQLQNINLDQEIIDTISTVKELKEMTLRFEEMYDWYMLQKNVIEIEIPKLQILNSNGDTVNRSLRLYEDTNKRFIEFCKKHNGNKVQDILNTALVEFLDRYEKSE